MCNYCLETLVFEDLINEEKRDSSELKFFPHLYHTPFKDISSLVDTFPFTIEDYLEYKDMYQEIFFAKLIQEYLTTGFNSSALDKILKIFTEDEFNNFLSGLKFDDVALRFLHPLKDLKTFKDTDAWDQFLQNQSKEDLSFWLSNMVTDVFKEWEPISFEELENLEEDEVEHKPIGLNLWLSFFLLSQISEQTDIARRIAYKSINQSASAPWLPDWWGLWMQQNAIEYLFDQYGFVDIENNFEDIRDGLLLYLTSLKKFSNTELESIKRLLKVHPKEDGENLIELIETMQMKMKN